LEETRANSSGQNISVKKKKEKAKTTSNVHWHRRQPFFHLMIYLKPPNGTVDAGQNESNSLFLAACRMEKRVYVSSLDMYRSQKERIY